MTVSGHSESRIPYPEMAGAGRRVTRICPVGLYILVEMSVVIVAMVARIVAMVAGFVAMVAGIVAMTVSIIGIMTQATQVNNKRIAKNTIALSARLFLTIVIGVYSSRLVLDALGVTDYGIYSVVGGIVTFFCFINASLIHGTQRFLNFYMGKGDEATLKRVFSTSVCIFAFLALLIFVLGETAGVGFLNFVLNIPKERIVAANVVCQFTILSAVIDVISLPYSALLVAYERMTVFAYVSVAQSVATLAVALVLGSVGGDKLMVYAGLLCLIQVAVRIFYGRYCSAKFPVLTVHRKVDRKLARDMTAFSGWTLTGSFAYIAYTQGIPMLFNMFFGPVINAANAIAQQVNASLSTFGANFMMAARPQITKYYAVGDMAAMKTLVFNSSKLSVLIMFMVSLPFMIMPDELLGFWLKEVPERTSVLMPYILWSAVVNSLATPVYTAIQATGEIKYYQIAETVVLLLVLPMAYFFLAMGKAPESSYAVLIVVMIAAQTVRVVFMKRQLQIACSAYLREVVSRLVVFLAVSYAAVSMVLMCSGHGLAGFVCVMAATVLLVPVVFLFVCFDRNDRSDLWFCLKKHIRCRYNRLHTDGSRYVSCDGKDKDSDRLKK